MPTLRKRYYAVRCGREGSKIYEDHDECTGNTRGLRGASQKTFLTKEAAEGWLLLGKYGLDSVAAAKPEVEPKLELENTPEAAPTTAPEATPDPIPGDKPSATSKPNSIISISSGSSQAISVSSKRTVISISSDTSDGTATPGPATGKQAQLSEEQKKVLEMVTDERNVFFTGSAGTGKSLLLREIIALCRRCGLSIAVTASTGIAAVNIGGSTLHSWAGIRLGKESKEKLARKILGQNEFFARRPVELYGASLEECVDDSEYERGQPTVAARWMEVEVLVIDEISMIDGDLFDKLEFIARIVRQDRRPFGGIQLIVSGDFFQLPPVPDKDENGCDLPTTFAFDAESWERCLGTPVFLTTIFRQKNQRFAKMLNEMRFGRVSDRTAELLRSCSQPIVYRDGIEPTELFATRKEVENANKRRLKQIPETPYEFSAVDTPGVTASGWQVWPRTMHALLERLLVQKRLTLKVGAQVMLVKNIEQGSLINGSVGKVVGFMTAEEASEQHIMIGVTKGCSEGYDPVFTAFSDPEVYPVVKFCNGRTMLCVRTDFDVTNPNGVVEARRRQVPLILAWAISIHKSQGMTLERVRVDMGSVFEKGQAYVALSRATSLDTLEIQHFDPRKVEAHPRVLTWQNRYLGTTTRHSCSRLPRSAN